MKTLIQMTIRPLFFAGILLFSMHSRAEAPALTAEDYKLYREYKEALTDERVQKLPEKKRMGAIAKNFKVPEKTLAAAIQKATAAGDDAPKKCEVETKTLLENTALKGRIAEISLDATNALVVGYGSWKNVDAEKLEEEAALIALMLTKGAPIASTLAVWAVDAAGKKVFEAKISASAASKFSLERIPMFAKARYMNQFEGVKNAFKGDTLSP